MRQVPRCPAGEVGVRPVIVLTKADLSPDPEGFVEAARLLGAGVQVQPINARKPDSVAFLAERCGIGDTVALVASSGVGKSTLVKTMTASNGIATQAVRESDGKGLHTTTAREMHGVGFGPSGGGWLVDTPGMRELQMSEVSSRVAEVFDDIVEITLQCRFTNCMHADEPHCAVRAAAGGRNTRPWAPCQVAQADRRGCREHGHRGSPAHLAQEDRRKGVKLGRPSPQKVGV